MKHLIAAGLAAACLATPALAEGMSNAFGNAVRVSMGEQSFDAWFSADGRYSDSRGLTGTWTYEGQLCIQVTTEAGPDENCGPWNETLAPGESWVTDGWSADGSQLTVQIIAG
ncbi:hypothetical protein [Maricaulis maris]|uniref:Secreted protein n=1 Tax=Maricaulis maris TaxID=74318 RepID=A0A495DMJ4_9PROT|nr:hypothetical protein [Maricaulis maris]RKR04154.1 hypothetical protein C7435_0598 [Maricaulis maris]